MKVFEISELFFKYDSSYVLEGISFEVNLGDFVGIIGSNGVGKSTLLKLLSKVLTPEKGSIKLFGKDLRKISTKEMGKKIAFVPQDYQFNFPFTCFDIVMMGRTPHLGKFGVEKKVDVEKVRQAMSETNSLSLSERPITLLSGGEKQKVLIAQAIAQDTPLILLDEPSSHLDIACQIEIFDTLKNLNQTKKVTMICALHDLNLASSYCNFLILLAKGKIFNTGLPSCILNYQNIKEVYGAEVSVIPHPQNGKPQILLLSKSP